MQGVPRTAWGGPGVARINKGNVNMTTGTVKWFNAKKGFGFIAPDEGDKDVFVHITAVHEAGLQGLDEGQKVTFEIQDDEKGLKAVNLSSAES